MKGRQADKAYSHGADGGLSNKSRVLFVPGGRFANRRTVLLITDGQSNVDKDSTVSKATILKNFGVNIYVFAVGSYIPGIGEMVQVAGNSSSTKPDGHLFRLDGYEEFWEFSKLVVEKVASSLSPDPSPSCQLPHAG